ncbi:MAG: PilN domain-containing protein [Acidobacteria bacterium]|nr:PilN domain-containing protein [Acidobacteriota bacterium]MCA1640496.1 PilN domain-containing protein [Acidobacteriota bacterium]
MIRVNLLESVTDRNGGSVAAVEARVSSPRGRGLLALLVVAGLLVAGVTFDWVSARGARAEAMAELQRQQEVAARMEAIKKEMKELEKRTQEVQTRIDAIKKLRAAQQGPVAVLSAVNDRLPRVADFRLESIEQKGDEVVVKGDSPDEAAVTQFGRSMEFSSGLFTNVSIETKREKMEVPKEALPPSAKELPEAAKPTTVSFTVKCKYTPQGAGNQQTQKAAAPSANQIAQK